jgi:site-specific DNA-methyltransferase (adenine-specific)
MRFEDIRYTEKAKHISGRGYVLFAVKNGGMTMDDIKIVYKQVSELAPYENNPRQNESAVDAVAASINDFGFKVPIIIDKDNTIVAGHTRLKAAMKLGIERVPCIVADDLTDEQVRAFRLVDNKVGELAEWDFTMLDEELASIDSIDMSAFGFNAEEIDWSEVEDLHEDTYEPPETPRLKCPHCGHIDEVKQFEKVTE